MTYGSCRFLFHQFIQRDKTHKIITDADALAPFTAALVRRPDVDRLNQIVGGISGQFVQIRVLMDLLDKQFQILILLFLYFDLLPQCLSVRFQGLLLFFVAAAHDGKALVTQLPGYVVLVDSYEELVELKDTLLCFIELLPFDSQDLVTLNTKPLFHFCPEEILIADNIVDDHLHVLPDQLLQNDGADKVCRASSGIAAIIGTDKVVLPLLKVTGGAVAHFGFAVRTEHKPGEHMGLSRFRSAVTLLSDFLHLVEHFWLDNRRMRVVEDSSIFFRILPLLLVPNGIRVGFEVDRAACVFLALQNTNDSFGAPVIRICGFRIGGLDSLFVLVCSWVQDLFFLQLLGLLILLV